MAQGQPDDERKGLVFPYPARVLTLAAGDVERLTALVRERHALDPTILDERSPFFWSAEISNNRIDAYFTRMAPSSLRNYAADAEAGVSFQNSHRHDELGFGRSLTGTYEETADLARVLAEFYTFPGLRLNAIATDDFILGVRSGLVKDVSIGFYGGFFRCSICGRNIWSWDCPHIPGIEYPKRDEVGNVTDQELAVAWVEDGRLAEASSVYDGATPGAAILKAQQEADGGRLRPEVASLLEARYRIKLPGAGRHWSGAATSEKPRGEGNMPEGNEEERQVVAGAAADANGPVARVISAAPIDVKALADTSIGLSIVAMLGLAEGSDVVEAVRRQRDQVAQLQAAQVDAGEKLAERERTLQTEIDGLRTQHAAAEQRAVEAEHQVADLQPLAADGRQYRADLLTDAMAEGVRAYGEGFAVELYRGVLDTAPLATVKRMRDDWRAIGDRLLQGGRLTQDRAEPAGSSGPAKKNGTPDAAFLG